MTQFNTDEIVVPITATTNRFEKKLRFVERFAARGARKTGKEYRVTLDREITQSKIGTILTKKVDTDFKAGRLAKSKSLEFKSKFNLGVKGLFKGINFGALSFGLNAATLAISAISAAIKKAKEREAEFQRGIESFNTTLISNNAYLSETARLNALVGNTALSASEKIALLSGEYVSLEDRIKKISAKDKFERITETLSNSDVKFEQLERKRGDLKDITRRISRGSEGPDGLKNKAKIEQDIRDIESQLRTTGKNIIDIFKGESPDALQAKLVNDGLREQYQLEQDLRVAQNAGEEEKAQSISDEIQRIDLRNKFFRANIDEYEELSRAYIKDQQVAREQGALKQRSLETTSRIVAEAAAQERKEQVARNAELSNATALYNSNRTAVETYASSLESLADLEAKIKADPELAKASGGQETIQRQRVAELIKLAQSTKDATRVFAEFERLQNDSLITGEQAAGVWAKLNDVLGITAKNQKAAAKATAERNKRIEEQTFLLDRAFKRELELARLANDANEIDRLERELVLRQKIDELKRGGITDKDEARRIANQEINEEDVARARGVFRTGFSDGLRAAIDGDLGSFLEQKLQSLAANMFDRAVENLADAVFDQMAQIAPGFLGQITGNANLPNALSGQSAVAAQTVAGGVTQATATGSQAAGAAGTATAITTALTTGGATLGTAIGTALSTGGATLSASVTAGTTAGGTAAATTIGASMTAAGTVVAAQIAAAMQLGAAAEGAKNLIPKFASGGVLGAQRIGLVGEEGPELISAGSAPLRITPLNGKIQGFNAGGLESPGTSQTPSSNVVMNISGVKDLGSFVKSQGTIEADMAAAVRRAQADF